MHKYKIALAALGLSLSLATLALADETSPKTNAPADAKAATNAVVKKVAAGQAAAASKTAQFTMISTNDAAYKSALDAHALDAALKQAGKDGAFKGKVSGIYEPGGMAILNFDTNYRTAMTALLKKASFDQFPPLTNLMDKEVVVTGKFIDYQGRAEIILSNIDQIKLVK